MKYFTLRELTHSDVALQNDIVNLPPHNEAGEVYYNLTVLVDKLLDPIHERFAVPMIITSGYRCEKVNKLVGGVDNSQHMKGQAVDFWFPGFRQREMIEAFFEIAEEFDFDQLVYYKKRGFIHISYNRGNNRHQIIIK